MIIHGDSAQELKKLADNSIDAVVTDPPYGIEFLAKEWDSNTGAVEIWSECFRVLKPGGYLLAFSAARTYHHLATNIESVGFEIRDQIMWLYASGFPKAQDLGKSIQRRQGVEKTELYKHNHPRVGGDGNGDAWQQNNVRGATIPTSPEAKQWSGWKTALKPAHEPICMARKPFKGSTIDNVLTHGVGALNIDATRIESEPFDYCADGLKRTTYSQSEPAKWNDSDKQMIRNDKGRYPSNVLGEVEGYQKFFYCPKVSRKERHRGFDIGNQRIDQSAGEMYGSEQAITRAKIPNVGNNHPTVKPVALMRYLVQLVTPQGAHVLDPFCGSGSTGMACKELGNKFTGIEQDKNYVTTAQQRIDATLTDPKHTLFE